MAIPKGFLVVPIGFRADGTLRALELTNTDELKVYITNPNLMVINHNLLDGNIHPDTEAGTVVKGDIIVGIDVGAGVIKWKRLARGSAGQSIIVQADGSLAYGAVSGGDTGHILAVDKKTSGTNGGDFNSGAWRQRDINTEIFDTGGHCSIASNQITLLAGTYRCRILCPAMNVARHQARLYNVTDSAVLATGTSGYNAAGSNVQSNSDIVGRFTLAASKVLQIQHQCTTTAATDGFGGFGGFGDEIYTIAEFWRE